MSKLHVLSALAMVMAASSFVPAAHAAPDAQPGIELQSATAYRFTVGSVRVTALSDGSVPIDLHALLRGSTPAGTDALLHQAYLKNPVEASINAFLLETESRKILVDTGSGDLFGPGNGGKLVEALAGIGVAPGQIDDILITHVHTDHSGGLVHDGRMTFTRAIVHVGKPDVDFFLDASNAARTGYDARYFTEAAKTLAPYVRAGRVRTFGGTAQILPGITAELHPGHTPGSAFYTLESRGERITFIGDIIHVAAIQFGAPDVTITFDEDQAKAARVRKQAFRLFSAERRLVAAPHLPFPGVGHIRAARVGYEWVPVDYGNRQVIPFSAPIRR